MEQEQVREELTIGGLIEWLSALNPELKVHCWEHGQDAPFDIDKHIDRDFLNKRIIIDLG